MSTKISALPASAGLSLTDIFPVVDDPAGTPVTQKADFSQLATLLGTGNFVLKAGDTMTGALVHPVGAVGTPSITFTGDLDTGVFHPAANTVGLSAGGTLVLSAITAGVNVTGTVNVSSDLNVSVNLNAYLGVATFMAGLATFNPDSTFQIIGLTGDIDDPFELRVLFDVSHTSQDPDLNRIIFSNNIFTIKTADLIGGAKAFEVRTSAFAAQPVAVAFFGVTVATQQSAAGNTLAEVLTALRAYGLLAP